MTLKDNNNTHFLDNLTSRVHKNRGKLVCSHSYLSVLSSCERPFPRFPEMESTYYIY